MVIREEFDRRITEINLYFEILKVIELDKPKLTAFDAVSDTNIDIIFDSQKINIFRASTFLLLYNLVESTVFNSVITIFDSINSDRHNPKLKYFDVIDDVKKYWLDNVYKHDEKMKKDAVINNFIKLSNLIFNESLVLASYYIKYGGSLDAFKIQETAKSLGVNIDKLKDGYRKDIHGEAFKEVQQKRNWLAHGEKTFAEIGQDYPFGRLDEFRQYIVEHLEKFIISIDDYIRDASYKRSNVEEIAAVE
ncbi:hypothetical protein N180_01210 [Pedobacter antarcticus 4BY]|uniref:MAE-28990/MAE-18760-like HEPN domain-containing protein n=2 Tax=Pedobacter antarcticus TaxID=34086 RepID=A0A081PC58_9SPHI|nr:MAE_28990/MAE_18760 family HEPN-like nuclease [Pedobacter antarcticus]KEQ28281.1 hypothetical protein N180_01210 [Pedobacter antarcticus 4BY]SFE47613.1 hypothetical protein SAMN03003324_00608 [Pedobacter antarcticus]